jgi:hypothetical protein
MSNNGMITITLSEAEYATLESSLLIYKLMVGQVISRPTFLPPDNVQPLQTIEEVDDLQRYLESTRINSQNYAAMLARREVTK